MSVCVCVSVCTSSYVSVECECVRESAMCLCVSVCVCCVKGAESGGLRGEQRERKRHTRCVFFTKLESVLPM